MKLKILGNCATEQQTYFGGEVVTVPAEVDEQLAEQWIKDGLAEKVETEPPVEAVEGSDEKPVIHAKRTRKNK